MSRALIIATLVGTGLNAGVFFSYSTFTMQGLARLQPGAGVEAMQQINHEAPRAPLMLLLFGTGALSIAVMVGAAGSLGETASVYRMVAAALFLAGAILVTAVYHVPRNNRLDAMDATSVEAATYWSTYLDEWVRMNHVRTIAPTVSTLLLALSLVVGEGA